MRAARGAASALLRQGACQFCRGGQDALLAGVAPPSTYHHHRQHSDHDSQQPQRFCTAPQQPDVVLRPYSAQTGAAARHSQTNPHFDAACQSSSHRPSPWHLGPGNQGKICIGGAEDKTDESWYDQGARPPPLSATHTVKCKATDSSQVGPEESDPPASTSQSPSKREKQLVSQQWGLKLKLTRADMVEQLLEAVEAHHRHMSPQTACHALIKLTGKVRAFPGVCWSHDRLCRAATLLAGCLEEGEGGGPPLPHRDVSNAAYAFARLGVGPRWAMAALERRAVDLPMGSFNSRDLEQLVWAMGRSGFRAPRLLASLEGRILEVLEHMEPFQVSNILWAYATLQQPAPRLFAKAAATAPATIISRLHVNALAALIWAYGTSGEPAPQAMVAACQRYASQRAQTAGPRQVSRLLAAYALTGWPAGPLFTMSASRISSMAELLSPRDVSRLLWAYSKLSPYSLASDVLKSLEPLAVRFCLDGSWSPREVAAAARAFALVPGASGRGRGQLALVAPRELLKAAPSLSLGEAVQAAWACATLISDQRHGKMPPDDEASAEEAEELQVEVIRHAGEKLVYRGSAAASSLCLEDLGRLAWAHAIARCPSPELFAAIKRQAVLRRLEGLTPRAMAQLSWSFAQLGHGDCARNLLQACLKLLLSNGSGDDLATSCWASAAGGCLSESEAVDAREILQRHQKNLSSHSLRLLLEAEAASGQKLVPEGLHDRAWQGVAQACVSEGNTQLMSLAKEVMSVLNTMGMQFRPGRAVQDGLRSTDLVLIGHLDDSRHVLLLEGPNAFRRDEVAELLGGSRMRRLLLEASGWRVGVLSAIEWVKLGDVALQVAYLRNQAPCHVA